MDYRHNPPTIYPERERGDVMKYDPFHNAEFRRSLRNALIKMISQGRSINDAQRDFLAEEIGWDNMSQLISHT